MGRPTYFFSRDQPSAPSHTFAPLRTLRRSARASASSRWASAAELVGKVEKGARVAPSRLTFGDYADEWLEGLDLRPRTLEGYAYRLDRTYSPASATGS
jgi:hypothetical protein